MRTIGVFTLVVVLALVGTAGLANAGGEAPFGYSPPDFYYSDNATVTHRSIECNNGDFLHFNHFMHFTYLSDYEAQTNLDTVELTPTPCGSPNSQDDQYWYATSSANLSGPDVLGDWKCFWKVWHECNRGRVRWNEATRWNATWPTKWNVACHEIGHGLSFRHGTTGNNCMDGGDNGIIDSYMIGKINGYY